jgi:hypothetical protein
MGNQPIVRDYVIPVAASTRLYQGCLLCINASGYAVPGSTATTLKAIGRNEQDVDNSAGAAGAVSALATRGVFKWNNSTSTDLITIADVRSTCYIVDDNTVAKTNGSNTRSVAGTVVQVDSDGVWVES